MECDRYWLLTNTCYGNWLPGDGAALSVMFGTIDGTMTSENAASSTTCPTSPTIRPCQHSNAPRGNAWPGRRFS